LIRPGAIGDFILSLPTLESARAEYTEVWARREVLPLVRFADRTRAIADTGLDRMGVVEGAQVPALAGFDSIYSWYGSNRPEFRASVAHLPFQFFPAFPPGLGVPKIPVPEVAREDFVVIHPFASSPAKCWPMRNFQSVAKALGEVRWLAGPEEALEGAVRIDNLYELAGFLRRARLYIGNDSGITHLAAAVGTPVIAVFVASDPAVWAPRGTHVEVLEQPSVGTVLSSLEAQDLPLHNIRYRK
jgi:heptosyltransferase III